MPHSGYGIIFLWGYAVIKMVMRRENKMTNSERKATSGERFLRLRHFNRDNGSPDQRERVRKDATVIRIKQSVV